MFLHQSIIQIYFANLGNFLKIEAPKADIMTLFGLFITPENWCDILKSALQAEELGFSSVWIDDHLLNFREPPEDRLEAWTTITAIAAKTKRIRLGNLVLCNSFRNPALLGKMVASLDIISNGRLELGIGAGWYESEYLAYGYPYSSHFDRISQLREGLVIIKKMFLEDKFDFNGKYWNLKECISNPKPLQNPFPIWVGGTGPKVTQIAVELATGLNVSSTSMEETKKIFKRVADYCDELGRKYSNFKKSYFTLVHLTSTNKERKEVIRKYLREWTPTPPKEFFEQLMIGTIEAVTAKINSYIDEFNFDCFMGRCRGTKTVEDPISAFADELLTH
ncbi:MAG: LLM class flavin-dependent oxidoreductase [Candidatus Hodarchaeota archaeon]